MGVLVIKGSVPGANGSFGKVRIVKWVRLKKLINCQKIFKV
jgi:ribosomal protein L3